MTSALARGGPVPIQSSQLLWGPEPNRWGGGLVSEVSLSTQLLVGTPVGRKQLQLHTMLTTMLAHTGCEPRVLMAMGQRVQAHCHLFPDLTLQTLQTLQTLSSQHGSSNPCAPVRPVHTGITVVPRS